MSPLRPGAAMIVLILQFSALLLLLALSAMFSGSETALFSLNPIALHRIARKNPRAARLLEALLARPTRPLSTILIGNTFVNIAAASLGYVIANSFFPGRGETVAIPVMTVFVIIFGELVPKRLAIRHSETFSVRILPVLAFLIKALTPFRWLLHRVTRPFEASFTHRHIPLSSEELRTLVDVGEQEGIINNEESVMMDGIIRLEKIEAREVMTPRPDIRGLDLEDDPATWRETVRLAASRFVPAYRGSLDHIEGFIDAPRYLFSPDAGDLKKALIHHFFVPDTMPLDNLLALFQQEKIQIAVVIDEYGGTDGLISREDVIEEIMPDLGDEHPEIIPLGPNRWKVDGKTSIEDVNDELDLELEADSADRIAGWFTEKAEHLPRAGEVLEAQGCRATATEIKRRRIRTVILEKIEAPEFGEETEP